MTYSRPVSGSNAAPPHSAPPSVPGIKTVPRALGGVNMPLESSLRSQSSTKAWASGVRLVTMASVKAWRAIGGGFNG